MLFRARQAISASRPYRRSDIEEVLADWDEMLDVDAHELHAVFRAVERNAAKREFVERPD